MLREFDKMFLCDTLEIPYSNLVVYDEIFDQDRWTTSHEVVFEYGGVNFGELIIELVQLNLRMKAHGNMRIQLPVPK